MPSIMVSDETFRLLNGMKHPKGYKKWESHDDVIRRLLDAYVPPGKD